MLLWYRREKQDNQIFTGGPMQIHPLTFTSLMTWLKLISENGFIDVKYLPMATQITLGSFLFSPLHIWQNLQMNNIMGDVKIHDSPIFVIGHWRSGTTFLHQLLTQDENFGFVSYLQGFTSGTCLVNEKLMRVILEKSLPKTRPMDNVAMKAELPLEEEHGIANVSTYSFYHSWYFPRKMKSSFKKYVLFEDVSEDMYENWKKIYLNSLKIASFYSNNKRLILKNPVNTAKIKTLLEIFPKAKFIHIYRNPYMVYHSSLNLHKKMINLCGLQDINSDELEENCFYFYIELMKKYFENKHLIPQGNLVEVKYEDLEANPHGELKRVYEELDIADFNTSSDSFRSYLEKNSSYQKNRYDIDAYTSSKIYQHWHWTIDKWKYLPPTNSIQTNT